MQNKDILIIIAVIVVAGLGYLIYTNSSRNNEQQQYEYIASVNEEPEKLPSIDTAKCSLNCCGYVTTPLMLDGLNSDNLAKAIESYTSVYNENGNLVRTNYSCGRATFAPGPYLPTGNNVGCPCVDKKTYSLIRSRGTSQNKDYDIDKSLLINEKDNQMIKPANEEKKSLFTEYRQEPSGFRF